MQRLDFGHPGEGQLVVGPFALGDDRYLVFAGAFERPVVIGGDVLDHGEWIVPGIDDAFEEGHAVSTLTFLNPDTMIRTPQIDTRLSDAPLPAAIPLGYLGLAGIK